MKKYLELLSEIPIFKNVNRNNIQNILNTINFAVKQYSRGEFIFHTGEKTKKFGIILEGQGEIIKEDFRGNNTLLAILLKGDLFAEAFACAQMPLTVSVKASTKIIILWIDYRILTDASVLYKEEYSIITSNLNRILAMKNVFLTDRIDHLSRRTLREKVLSYLSEQSVKTGSRTFKIPFNRQGLADYLAADRSALSYVLCKLRDENIIKFHKNEFTLL